MVWVFCDTSPMMPPMTMMHLWMLWCRMALAQDWTDRLDVTKECLLECDWSNSCGLYCWKLYVCSLFLLLCNERTSRRWAYMFHQWQCPQIDAAKKTRVKNAPCALLAVGGWPKGRDRWAGIFTAWGFANVRKKFMRNRVIASVRVRFNVISYDHFLSCLKGPISLPSKHETFGYKPFLGR